MGEFCALTDICENTKTNAMARQGLLNRGDLRFIFFPKDCQFARKREGGDGKKHYPGAPLACQSLVDDRRELGSRHVQTDQKFKKFFHMGRKSRKIVNNLPAQLPMDNIP